MDRKHYIFLLLSLFTFACEKSDIEYETSFEKSYKAWLDFKASSNDSYRYVARGETWAGSSWQTTITVENGEVIRRDFQYDIFNDVMMLPSGWNEQKIQEILDAMSLTASEFREQYGQESAEILEWTEEAGELGTHEATSAGSLLTLDEVYDEARNDWLKKRSNAKTYFEAKNNGLISSCGYVEDGCQDDCFRGIKIVSIQAL